MSKARKTKEERLAVIAVIQARIDENNRMIESSLGDMSHLEEIISLRAENRRLGAELENERLMLLDKLYCNQHIGSDVHPYEVLEKKTDRLLIVRSMKSEEKPETREKRIASFVPGGFCGHFDNGLQEWECSSDPDGYVKEIRLHKDGYWYESNTKHCPFILSDKPKRFYDFNY